MFFFFTEVLEEALVSSDPEGPLCELLFFFLTAIFQALDEEQEEVAKDQAEGQTNVYRVFSIQDYFYCIGQKHCKKSYSKLKLG